MTIIRGLLALLLLPFMMAVPTAAEAHHPAAYGAEHCAAPTEEMDMIFIRHKPANYARIEKRVNAGECRIQITGHCNAGWCPVRQGKFDGWMHRAQLAPMSPPVFCVARVDNGWSLDVHEGPSRSTKVVVSVHEGTCGIAATPFQRGRWVRIKVHGHYGWVAEANLR
jgi:SH3-like domain-containing protein